MRKLLKQANIKTDIVQKTGRFCSTLQLEEDSDKANFETLKMLEREQIKEMSPQNICSCQENKISKD